MRVVVRSNSTLQDGPGAPEIVKYDFRPDAPYIPVEALASRSADPASDPSKLESDSESDDDSTGSPSFEQEQDGSPIHEQETSGGRVYHAQIRLDSFNDPKECLESGELKPRRAMPQIKVSDLFAGLIIVNGRWIYKGPLNGWPALTNLELRSLTRKRSRLSSWIQYVWRADKNAPLPDPKKIVKGTRATFMSPTWANIGWAPDSPGFVFWYSDQRGGGPQTLFGEQLYEHLRHDELHGSAQATFIHTLAHRYPVATETVRDRQTWHAACLLEWSHGRYTTLVELAWRHGLGGYGGKSNWVEDKLEPSPKIFESMPDSMKSSWCPDLTEIRIVDLPAKTLEEFQAFLEKYSNRSGLPLKEQRFLDPKIFASAPVRVRACTQADFVGYMLNYIHRAPEYGELTVNCQTFTADLYSFLAGVKESQPYGMVCRPGYKQRSYSFLYMPRRD